MCDASVGWPRINDNIWSEKYKQNPSCQRTFSNYLCRRRPRNCPVNMSKFHTLSLHVAALSFYVQLRVLVLFLLFWFYIPYSCWPWHIQAMIKPTFLTTSSFSKLLPGKAWWMAERLVPLLATQIYLVWFPVPTRPSLQEEKVSLFCNPSSGGLFSSTAIEIKK
jgi:hypothetical protein